MLVNVDIDFANLYIGAVSCLNLKTLSEDIFITCNQPTKVRKVKIQHHFTGIGIGDIVIVESRFIIQLNYIVRNTESICWTLVIKSRLDIVQIILPVGKDGGNAIAYLGHTHTSLPITR